MFAKRLIAGVLALVLQIPMFFRLLNPLWWWSNRSLNVYSPSGFGLSRKGMFFFRLDLFLQNQFGICSESVARRWETEVDLNCFTGETPIPIEEIDCHDRLPSAEQIEKIREKQRPAVFRGLLKQSSKFSGSWSIADLLARFGEQDVTLSCPIHDGYPGKFKEIDIDGVYLHNSEEILRAHPELYRETGFDIVPQTIAKDMMFIGTLQLFAGKKKTGSWWHCAGGSNFFLMLNGQKKWRFIDPKYSPAMFPKTRNNGRSVYYQSDLVVTSDLYQDFTSFLKSSDKKRLEVSKIEKNREHLTNIYEKIPTAAVTLEPGDVLFNPPWWWHDVENVTAETIGVATRWLDKDRPGFTNTAFDIFSRLNFSHFKNVIHDCLVQNLVRDNRFTPPTAPQRHYDFVSRSRTLGFDKYADGLESVEEYYERIKSQKSI